MKRIFLFGFVFVCAVFAQDQVIKKGNIYYLSNTVVVKLKNNSGVNATNIGETVSKSVKGVKVEFAKQTFNINQVSLNKGEESLSRIYTLTIDNQTDPLDAAKKISHIKQIEWAEPKYVDRVTAVPDDSLYVLNLQKNLQRINAAQAWDISTGDTTVIIGIVDTGVDWNHPDLDANIYRKDGVKVGYDLGGLDGTPDSDPSEDKPPGLTFGGGYHGTHVAGIACAVTNNKIGVASIGYNCSIIPVKASRSDRRDNNGYPYIIYGFEGIKYAADNGAKVINCSWGGTSYSQLEQETIDYALSKGALVVAAQGNENSKLAFYPADYNGVLAVGWLNTDNDTKNGSGNYNIMVDVMAPGTSILSTWPTYSGLKPPYNGNLSGSSMSSPLAAGLAGLVTSHFPNYTPLQVAERIRVTCDDVYSVNADSLKYLLGRGRINAYSALSETDPVSVRATNVEFVENGNGNGQLESGESAEIKITFTNFLSGVSNVKVSLSSSDQAVSISDSVFNTGSLNTLDSVNNNSVGFKFSVVPNGPYNHTVNFLLRYSGNNYSDYQWISTRVNPTYDNLNNNNIELTVTSKGAVGFNDYPDNLEGVGLKYMDQDNVLFEGALMYGTGPDRLMDVARETLTQSTDFSTIIPVQISYIEAKGEQKAVAVFNDDGAGSNKLGIKTTMQTYSYAAAPNNNFVIIRTQFENTTQSNINGLYSGYYFDFDIPATGNDYGDDMVDYDETDSFGYAYDSDGQPQNIFIGSTLVSSGNQGFYAINQDSVTGPVTPNSNDGFNDSEKWYAISNGIKKLTAGPADISYVISGGPFNVEAGKTVDVAFALACGSTREDLRTAIKQSRIKWNDILTDVNENNRELPKEFTLLQNYPNPFNPSTIIEFTVPNVETHHTASTRVVSLKVYDILGNEVATLVSGQKSPGNYKVQFNGNRLPSGIYFYRLVTEGFSQTKKMMLLK